MNPDLIVIKKCGVCSQEFKDLTKNHVSKYCKPCQVIMHNLQVREGGKRWRKTAKGKLSRKLEGVRYLRKYPLKRIFQNIKARCNYDQDYIKKGIKCFLTWEDLKMLGQRDGADKMIKPSLHRKNSNNHYTINNCEFLEWIDHNKLHLTEIRERAKK